MFVTLALDVYVPPKGLPTCAVKDVHVAEQNFAIRVRSFDVVWLGLERGVESHALVGKDGCMVVSIEQLGAMDEAIEVLVCCKRHSSFFANAGKD